MGKAKTRAQKLAGKRGPKYQPATLNSREPNGRLSRRKERTVRLEYQNREVEISRRITGWGLEDYTGSDGKIVTAEAQAIDTRRGYVLGRMLLDGSVSHSQHDAGIRYARDVANYLGMSGISFPSARAQSLFAVRSHVGEETELLAGKARKAKERMTALRTALQGDEMASLHKSYTARSMDLRRNIQRTIDAVCVEDIDELRHLHPAQQKWLMVGLNRLVKFYGTA